MKNVKVTIEGVRPMLCNRFTEEQQERASKGSTAISIGTTLTPYEEAEKKLYKGLDGALVIPSPNILSCITAAGTFFKAGKGKITTGRSSLIPACVEIDAIDVKVVHNQPWRVDTRSVVNPSTKGRRPCHRPCFDDWSLSFDLIVDTEIITVELLRELIDTAGKRIGLGDFRPDRKGPFGKFKVTLWKVSEMAKAA